MRISCRTVPVGGYPLRTYSGRSHRAFRGCLRAPGSKLQLWLVLLCLGWLWPAGCAWAAEAIAPGAFPRPLESYAAPPGATLWQVLAGRVQAEPFNLVATAIFFLAIIHTFLAAKFTRLSLRYEHQHQERLGRRAGQGAGPREVSLCAVLFHFLGEVEVIFGIWIIPLLVVLTIDQGWPTARDYIGHRDFTEPLFVVVIMAMAASRPILKFSEQCLSVIAGLGQGSAAAWWFTILMFGPLLGSLITEPAAITISALLLAEKFYRCKPTVPLAYATLGLLFVNVSVGGTLTHFAAPPVLMVAGKWGWGLAYMLSHFGWKAAAGMGLANVAYFLFFRKELNQLQEHPVAGAPFIARPDERPVPVWVTVVHALFLAWTVMTSHYPALFVGGFLFYLAFHRATEHHQTEVQLRPALLVGFFLAGLVVHGGLQGWWIGPVLRGLKETPLFVAAAGLTAFNDNAAITYLASLVPELSASLKYAVVAGAVVGGGLTVIANAPNPAGQAILAEFFPEGVSPLKLFLGALLPTLLIGAVFLLL